MECGGPGPRGPSQVANGGTLHFVRRGGGDPPSRHGSVGTVSARSDTSLLDHMRGGDGFTSAAACVNGNLERNHPVAGMRSAP